MKKKLSIILLILCNSFSQGQNEKALFVVDSIPIIEEPKKDNTLSQDEINNVVTITKRQTLDSLGYNELDKVIYVFTKAYMSRPDSIKSIPSTGIMENKNGTWYLRKSTAPYSGRFIDYYMNGKKQGQGFLFNGKLKGNRKMFYSNGNVSDDIEYENGIANGLEKRYYEDGTLKQEGIMKNQKEIGTWKSYHPNGQIEKLTTFNNNGKVNGESISYYSTGNIKSSFKYKDGKYIKDKNFDKFYKLYNDGQENFKLGNFKSAIKKYSKCIELNPTSADAYFARGTANLNEFDYEWAISDFNKTLEIEPYFTNAYANRAFVIIRKYEFANSRKISKMQGVTIMASKKAATIPENDKIKICKDLKKAVSLGDKNWMVLDALKKHCQN